ncbi:MAG: PAS domain S-box protein [Candidatus Kuenenia sp.]|nr:PAS domain S-box protein [Candidatus Kuenenia hertensis]
MVDNLKLLHELIPEIMKAKDFSTALHTVLSRICEATEWVYGDAWLPSSDRNYLVWNQAYCQSEKLEIFKEKSKSLSFPPGVGLPGRIWASGKPAWILDVTCDTNFPRTPIARECGLKAGMGVPILDDVEVVAVMSFFNFERREEDEQMVTLIATAAAELGYILKYKQMERKLQQLSSAVEQSVCSVVITDTDGNIEYVNPKFIQMTGYTPEETVGKNPRMLKSGITPQEEYKNLWKTIRRGNNWQGVFCNKKKDGTLFWELANISPIKDSNGNITHFLGCKEDITARKRSEWRLRTQYVVTCILAESNSLSEAFPKILKAVCECLEWDIGEIWVVDRDANVLRIAETWYTSERAFPKFMEITKEITFSKSIGLPGSIWKRKKPIWVEDVTRETNFPRSIIANREGLHGAFGFPIISNEECVGVMVFFSHKIQSPDNEILDMINTIGNQIGQFIMRKRAETQFYKLSQAVEQSPNTVIIADTNGCIQYVNSRFTQLTGYTLEEVIGKTPSFLDSGITPRNNYNRLWGSISSVKEGEGEVISKKKNGEFFYEKVCISLIKDERDIVTNILITGEDITAIKDAEEEQKKLKEQLYHAQRLESIGRLAGGVAHDFNNILMAITGYINIMQMEMDENTPLRQYLAKILTATERANILTNELLTFGRKQPFDLKPISANNIIKDAIFFLEGIYEKDINIELNVVLSEKEYFVMADKHQMGRAMLNLSKNAKDAMLPDGGNLTVGVMEAEMDDTFVKTQGYGKAGRYALLFVSDTGIGMDEKTKERIFEPFFTTKGIGKGTGLGLATVYGIVKQHNGFIGVDSEPEKGSTFNIYLPLVNVSTAAELAPKTCNTIEFNSTADSSITKGKEGILIAEDDEGIRILLENVLKRYGYRVIAAANGEDAVNKFAENKNSIQLLLFDVTMPVLNGKNAYHKIKDIRPDIKTIFMSGFYDDYFNKERFSKEEGISRVTKPISPNQLLGIIREVLDK